MELKEYLRELDSGNNKVLGDVGREIYNLKINEFLMGFHLLKKCIKKIHEENKGLDIHATISFNEGDSGYYLNSNVYLEGDEVIYPKDKDMKNKIVEIEYDLSDATERLVATSSSWVGLIKDECVVLNFKYENCVDIDDWILGDKLKPLYDKAILELELNENLPSKSKKMKV